jgi:tetratricopeptide (TPR) repeat protein
LSIANLAIAGEDFERAIKLDKRYADAYNNLGVVYYADKNAGKAIKQYKKAIELHADVAPFHNNLGAAYFQKKDFDKAVQSYSEALRLDPGIFERTAKYYREIGVDSATVGIVVPMPGTQLFAQMQREGRLLTTNWDKYNGKVDAVFRPARMTAGELEHGAAWFADRFYSLPSIFYRLLVKSGVGLWWNIPPQSRLPAGAHATPGGRLRCAWRRFFLHDGLKRVVTRSDGILEHRG